MLGCNARAADSFNIVTVRIKDERRVVVRVVLGAQARQTIGPCTRRNGCLVKPIDGSTRRGDEGQMKRREWFRCDDDSERPVLATEAESLPILRDHAKAERLERALVKGSASTEIGDGQIEVIDQTILRCSLDIMSAAEADIENS
jgi:hypothetical protein